MLRRPNKRELQETVFWEAEQYLPFDISEVILDFDQLNDGKDGSADIMLVAVKKSVLEKLHGSG